MRPRQFLLISLAMWYSTGATIAFATNDAALGANISRSRLSFENLSASNFSAIGDPFGSSSAAMEVESYPPGRGTSDTITGGTKVTSKTGNEGGTVSVTIYNNKVESSGKGNGGSAITVTIINNNTHNSLYQRFVKWWKSLWNSEASRSTSKFRH
ncbi:hypothetical protein GQ600_24944 [Phytophthora cactorum]|nr:hypothetical protein GQ600_24944 [Phytophthora cactorum]